MTQLTQSQIFIDKHKASIKQKQSNFLIIFDWDGVFTSTERMSHFAAYEILKKYNATMPEKMSFSNQLFGVKVKDQRLIMERYFVEQDLNIVFPDDFDRLRDEEQMRMFEGLQMVNGMGEFAETFKHLNLNRCIASRSRVDPFVAKVRGTKMNEVIPEQHWFLPDTTDKTDFNWRSLQKMFDEKGILKADREFDKVEIFSFACVSMGFSLEQCIVVEDSVKGVLSAQKLGMTPLCFLGAEDTDEIATRETLEGILLPEQICNTADELLLAILKKIIHG